MLSAGYRSAISARATGSLYASDMEGEEASRTRAGRLARKIGETSLRQGLRHEVHIPRGTNEYMLDRWIALHDSLMVTDA